MQASQPAVPSVPQLAGCRDQYNHSFLGCLIQVFLATGIEQPPGQLRRLEAALRKAFIELRPFLEK